MSHLLLIHQAFSSLNDTGGTRHFEFAQHLISRGHRVTIVTSNLNYHTAERIRSSEKIDRAAPVVLRAPTLNFINKGFAGRVVAFVAFMISSTFVALRVSDVDVVMGTSPPIFQSFSAYLVAKLKRRPFLLEIRDLWPDFAIDIGILKNRALIRASRAAERFLYEHADHILVNSPAYVGHVTGKGIPGSKVSLIPNGVNPDMFAVGESSGDFRKRFNLHDKFVVTYAGALGLANDIPTILRAAERLSKDPEVLFLIAGDGKERRDLQAEVQARNLSNVMFVGAIPKSAIPQLLAAADVCLATLRNIPMFRMTYPNKVFDYLAAGKPIILAIDGVIREVVERAQAGLYVTPGNDEELAAAVQFLRTNSELRLQMGKSGSVFVRQHFNRNNQAKEFRKLVELLAANQKSLDLQVKHVEGQSR